MYTIYLLVFLVFLYIFAEVRSRKNNLILREKKTQLKNLYKNEAVFLCDAVEGLGRNLIQFYGEPFGVSVRSGMKISDLGGVEYLIKEVYANDKSPSKPDLEISNGMANSTIVIEAKNFNLQSFKQKFKSDRVIALKLH